MLSQCRGLHRRVTRHSSTPSSTPSPALAALDVYEALLAYYLLLLSLSLTTLLFFFPSPNASLSSEFRDPPLDSG